MIKCRKRRYVTEMDAKLALYRVQATGRGTQRRETRYYWCRECKAYHLTSKPR